MGARRRHANERERAEGAQPKAVLQRAEERGGVLGLQRSAGNRAVAEQLQVARDKSGSGEPPSKKTTLTLGALDHPLDVLSYTIPQKPPTSATGGDRETDSGIHEIVVTVAVGDQAPRINAAAADGRPLGDGDLVTGAMTLHMTDVLISNLSISGSGTSQTMSFTLNFASVQFKFEKPDDNAGQGPDSPKYDLTKATGA